MLQYNFIIYIPNSAIPDQVKYPMKRKKQKQNEIGLVTMKIS